MNNNTKLKLKKIIKKFKKNKIKYTLKNNKNKRKKTKKITEYPRTVDNFKRCSILEKEEREKGTEAIF